MKTRDPRRARRSLQGESAGWSKTALLSFGAAGMLLGAIIEFAPPVDPDDPQAGEL